MFQTNRKLPGEKSAEVSDCSKLFYSLTDFNWVV